MDKQEAIAYLNANKSHSTNYGTCKYWQAMDIVFSTPTSSPLHHVNRHASKQCRDAK